MLDIGIDKDQGLVYEGTSHYGRVVWPTPIVTPAKIVVAPKGQLTAESSSRSPGCTFREDYFDPVSRIRRGRFYFAAEAQPTTWILQPNPTLPLENRPDPDGKVRKGLDTFRGRLIWHQYLKDQSQQPLVLLGVDERFTPWTMINIEAISTGEDLVTLKARTAFGILPHIDKSRIPVPFHDRVEERLETFTDEVHRSAPSSVIDRARDAATQILLAYFELEGEQSKDLGPLAKKLDEREKYLAANAAKIIASLHSRGKPSERGRRETRGIREQDAELATQCVGTILCELGWADWVSR